MNASIAPFVAVRLFYCFIAKIINAFLLALVLEVIRAGVGVVMRVIVFICHESVGVAGPPV
jgi:hypothetical protein